MAFDPADIVDAFDEPKLPDGTLVPDGAVFLITFPPAIAGVTGLTYGMSLPQLRAALLLGVIVKAAVNPPTFADFVDSAILGGSVRIVAATGVPLGDYRYKIGVQGNYNQMPVDGVISVGNQNTAVYVYSVETPTRQQSATARSQDFVASAIVVLPIPDAPTFINFLDTAAGGSVQLVVANGVPMLDYRYKIGVDSAYAQIPADGLISVGNVTGQVFAYSVSSSTRQQGPTASSATFTAYSAPVIISANTTPNPPTFSNFTQYPTGGGSVQLVPAAGVPLTDYQYKVTAAGNYQPLTVDGMIVVGNITGSIYAYSVANGSRTASLAGQSQAFTAYVPAVAATVPGQPTNASASLNGNIIGVNCYTPTNGGAAITGYNIYRNGGVSPLAQNIQLSYGNYLDTFAVAGTAYYYTIAAVNSVGIGPQSAPSNTVTIPLPVVVAPVITTYSYTTSAADYAFKCGTGTTGAAVTKTSTLSLADATSQAIAGITCPVPVAVTAISYHGVANSPNPLPAEIQAMFSETWAFAPRTIVYTAFGTYPLFSEPQSYGTRNVIQDINGFDVTGDITRTSISYTVNSVIVPYYRYVHNNPQYDPAFTLKFL